MTNLENQAKNEITHLKIVKPVKDDDFDWPAELLAQGELVAFPTETVYGLGANALDEAAVAKIFQVKGRPSDNPLIVHVADKEDIFPLVGDITPLAQCMIDAFMPGPITLVMHKNKRIPDLVSAGLDTVGIRLPAHPVARKLIRLAGVPVAAPSANLSGSPSPTKAQHVAKDLEGRILCVVDGGDCEVGLESTVVDVTDDLPIILRPGAVTKRMIWQACCDRGITRVDGEDAISSPDSLFDLTIPRAPGMKYRHYAPDTPIKIVMPDPADPNHYDFAYELKLETMLRNHRREQARNSRIVKNQSRGLTKAWKDIKSEFQSYYEYWQGKVSPIRLGVFCSEEDRMIIEKNIQNIKLLEPVYYIYGKSINADQAAHGLFDGLRHLDNSNVEQIFVAGFKGDGIESAYMNRLRKAAGEDNDVKISRTIAREPGKKVLFVCTANTCRSPMAEVIFNLISDARGPYYKKEKEPKNTIGISASSAGIFANPSDWAEPAAISAVNHLYQVNLKAHRSRPVSNTVMKDQDLVFAVTQDHAQLLRRKYPESISKIYSFSEYIDKKEIDFGQVNWPDGLADIPDPYGQQTSAYERTAEFLFSLLDAMWVFILEDLEVDSSPKTMNLS